VLEGGGSEAGSKSRSGTGGASRGLLVIRSKTNRRNALKIRSITVHFSSTYQKRT
jgi:hypothetical protein